MTTTLASVVKRRPIRNLPMRALRGGLLAVGVPIAIVGTLLQAVGFVAFTAAENVGARRH